MKNSGEISSGMPPHAFSDGKSATTGAGTRGITFANVPFRHNMSAPTLMKGGKPGGTAMDSLSRMIEMAKAVRTSEAEREEQRRSFVYGNTAVENETITRDMVDRKAETLRSK